MLVMTTAATACRRCLVFFFLVVVVMGVTVTAAATAASRLDFLGLFRMTAAAAACNFRLAFTQQGFDQCQHVVSFCSCIGVLAYL